jgi:hypothetical protein
MPSSKEAVVLVVVSTLAAALIYSSLSRSNTVFAAYTCENFGDVTVKCCQNITDSKGVTTRWCTTCTNSDPPSNCSPRFKEGRPNPTTPPTAAQPPSTPPPTPPSNALPPSTSQRTFSPTGGCIPGGTTCIPCDIGLARIGANCIPSGDWHPGLGTELGGGGTPPTVQPPPAQGAVTEQPPTNVAPPKVCPDGSAPDANGNCPTTTTNTNQQGGSASNNNNPTSGHHKGSNQPTQTGGGQESTVTKKHKGSKTDQGTTQSSS